MVPYELTAINNVSINTGIHTFHITGICPGKNMPTTECILYSKYRLNTTAHISNNDNKNVTLI